MRIGYYYSYSSYPPLKRWAIFGRPYGTFPGCGPGEDHQGAGSRQKGECVLSGYCGKPILRCDVIEEKFDSPALKERVREM